MRIYGALLVCGCYAPTVPTGAPCDPIAPRCPAGQVCLGEPASCRFPGSADAPAPPDAAADAAPLAYIVVTPGWAVDVFHDFSAEFTYAPIEFDEGLETYDNHPDHLFALEAPFQRGLGLIAGRRVIELSATTFTPHDFGQHPPNTMGQPDNLTGGVYVANLDANGPALLVSSSSLTAGDGSFRISPTWTIASDNPRNNTRTVLFDPAGAFDARPTAEGYLGIQNGVVRRSDDLVLATGDTQSMRVVGADLLLTRHLTSSAQLIRLASQTHDETVLAEHTLIRIGEGTPPAPYLAWVIVDQRQVALVAPTGQLETILESTDAQFTWWSIAAPSAPHPLAGAIYLLEANRTRDLDRVLVITPP